MNYFLNYKMLVQKHKLKPVIQKIQFCLILFHKHNEFLNNAFFSEKIVLNFFTYYFINFFFLLYYLRCLAHYNNIIRNLIKNTYHK